MNISRSEILRQLAELPPSSRQIFSDLLARELAAARAELEAAETHMQIWRAQGAVRQISTLITIMNRSSQ